MIALTGWLEEKFKLKEHGTDVRTEILAGITTFLTMCYIIFVNPVILGAAGMDKGAVMVATCVGTAIGTFLMGILANYPIAMAPGMGHNAFFAFIVCGAMGFTWQQALGANFISGTLFLILVLAGMSQAFVDAVPLSLKHAIAVGIGLLLALIGLEWGGFIAHSPPTMVTLGDLSNPSVLIATVGFLVMVILLVLNVRGAIIIGLLVGLLLSLVLGITHYRGIFSAPPSITPTAFRFAEGLASFGAVGRHWVDLIAVIFVLLFLDIFDTVGTLIGVTAQAGLLKNGELPKAKEALLSDAIGTVVGVCLGTSTITSYIESSAGIAQGGRTGLTAIVVSLLFLLGLFFYPLMEMMSAEVAVPIAFAAKETPPFTQHPIIAPALILVGVFMMTGVRHIQWEDFTEAIPAFLTLVLIPLTFSITEGIAFGFISYALLKLVTRRHREAHWLLYLLSVLFLALFVARTYLTG
ncbi:MAG: NCS2 family permease [Candidatus Fervidibacter sp.]|uniref:NCS2 family permease n=1 Tax=Candidatus Fervidibacter sp. TaxID=3100871 RepID=UPI00404A7842